MVEVVSAQGNGQVDTPTPEAKVPTSIGEQKEIADNLTFGEKDVGIELFYADTNPEANPADFVSFVCAYKHRFADFIVNEIDESGEVVWFSSENENLQKWKPAALK